MGLSMHTGKTHSGKKGGLVLVLVLSLVTFALMGDLVLIPIAGNLYAVYDDTALVNFMLSGPALICAVVSAFSGALIDRIGAKRVLCTGFGVYTASSLCTAFVQEALPFVACRVLQGVGMGVCTVCCVVVIANSFADESMRSKMMGVYNGMMALMGTFLGLLSGMIAASGWTNVFYLYLATVPILACIVLLLPADHVKRAARDSVADASASKDVDKPPFAWAIVVRIALAFFAYNIIYCVVYYQVSIIMAEKGFADTAFVGMMASLGTLGSFVACTTFGWYFARMKRFTITCGFVLQAIFFSVLFVTDSEVLCAISCLCLGIAYGLGLTYYLTYATLVVPPEHVATATSIVSFSMSISMFGASYLPYALMGLFGLDSVLSTLPILICVLVAGSVLSVFFGRRERGYCELAAQAELDLPADSAVSSVLCHHTAMQEFCLAATRK